MKIEATTQAIKFVREALGLDDAQDITLDFVLDHAILGHEADRAYLTGQAHSPTLDALRYLLVELIREKAEMVNRLATLEPNSHSPDDCAATILALCPPETHMLHMKAAREQTGLPDAEIIASVLIANWDSLHAGDVSQLRPRTQIAASRGVSVPNPLDAMHAPQTCQLPDCRRSFIPKRIGPAYGCQHCGEVAHRRKMEEMEAKRATEVRGQTYLPRTIPWDAAQCTCGLPSEGEAAA